MARVTISLMQRDSIAVIFMAYYIRGSELSNLGNTTANELTKYWIRDSITTPLEGPESLSTAPI
jgi:hypothetical protein